MDKKRALLWFRKAAAAGDIDAQFNVGYFLEHGIGGPRDKSSAKRWYAKAAKGGERQAELALQGLVRARKRPAK
jgi:TPR repeat protein